MNCQRQVQVQVQVRLEKEQCHSETTTVSQSASQPAIRSVSQSVIGRFQRLPSFFQILSCLLLSHVFRCFSSRNLQQTRPKNKNDKKRSTFQRALARVRSLHSGLGLVCFICLPCPASRRPRNVNVHVESQQGCPGAAEPLYSLVLLVLAVVYTTVQYVSSPPPVGRCQRMCQPKWLSPFKTSCCACRACPALVLPPHTSFSPDTALGPSRITTRKLSAVQGEKEVSE